MKLSVSMIVKNEEQVLSKCLDSIKDADEIVILDTGSTDKTAEIARQYGNVQYIAGLYFWNDNFSEARNKSLSFCTGDWILIIDADEHLENGGIQKVREEIEKIGGFKTMRFRVISNNGFQEHRQIRVFKNCGEIFWKGAVHNYLNVSESNDVDIKVFYGYSPAHQKDPDRALRILKKEVEKNPNSSREKYYFAREYLYRKDYITALYWYDRYLDVATWAPEIADAWLYKARCLWNLYRGEEARNACLQAIKYNANFQEALEFMASISGPGNKKRWLEFASTASNSGLLFNRSDPRKRVYYCDGMKVFGDAMVKSHGYVKYNSDLDIYRDTFFEGLYFVQDYEIFSKHLGRAVVFWNGTDMLRLSKSEDFRKKLSSRKAVHLCHFEHNLQMLKELGISAHVNPLFFGDIDKYPISYRQNSIPNIYAICHPGRETEYGIDFLLSLAPETPGVMFHIYGVDAPSSSYPSNVIYHGFVPEEQMDKETCEFQGALKFSNSGLPGIPQTVLKSGLMGQYPISLAKVPGCWQGENKEKIKVLLEKLATMREPNFQLREMYMNLYVRGWDFWDCYDSLL